MRVSNFDDDTKVGTPSEIAVAPINLRPTAIISERKGTFNYKRDFFHCGWTMTNRTTTNAYIVKVDIKLLEESK